MADASSSDTTSDCCNECFSDITSEKSEYVVVGRKPCPSHRRSKRNLLQKLFIREVGRPESAGHLRPVASDRPRGIAPLGLSRATPRPGGPGENPGLFLL